MRDVVTGRGERGIVAGRDRRRRARTAVAAAVVAVVVVAGCSAAAPAPPADVPDTPLAQRINGQVTGAEARVHLEALQRIATASGGNRAAGTPGYEQSVDYVADTLRRAGFDVTTPTYEAGHGRRLRNVVARTRGTDPARVVLAGAHLDSVAAGPGINDNGTGVAALLETALKLGPSPGTRNTIAFGFWGSEEDDQQGSTGYVADLSDEQRAGHLVYMNLDMLGSRNGGYFVQGGVGDDDEETGAPGSGPAAQVFADELAATGVPTETKGLDGDDDEPFTKADIPVIGVVTGDEQKMSPEQARRWNGTAGRPHDSCYHQACDTLDNVDPVRFDRYTKAVASTLARFGDAAARPTS